MQFYIAMQNVGVVLSPFCSLASFVYDFTAIIANRVALEIFVTYHRYKTGPMSEEIQNLTLAIKAIEDGRNGADHLSSFIKEGNFVLANVNIPQLLQGLKAHRYWFWNLYNGIQANQALKNDIYNYLKHPESPGYKLLEARNPPSTKRRIDFEET